MMVSGFLTLYFDISWLTFSVNTLLPQIAANSFQGTKTQFH